MREYELTLKLLRLACKSANGMMGERQNALDKAIQFGKKYNFDIQITIKELGSDISDLEHAFQECSYQAPPEVHADTSYYRQAYPRRSSRNPDKNTKSYPIAGFQFYDGPGIKASISVGDILKVVALTTNPHDPHAVAILRGEFMLGYLPRSSNSEIWTRLRAGEYLICEIVEIFQHNSYGAVKVTVAKGTIK